MEQEISKTAKLAKLYPVGHKAQGAEEDRDGLHDASRNDLAIVWQ